MASLPSRMSPLSLNRARKARLKRNPSSAVMPIRMACRISSSSTMVRIGGVHFHGQFVQQVDPEVGLFDLALVAAVVDGEASFFEDLADGGKEFGELDRFGHVVVGTFTHAFQGGMQVGHRGQHDDGHVREICFSASGSRSMPLPSGRPISRIVRAMLWLLQGLVQLGDRAGGDGGQDPGPGEIPGAAGRYPGSRRR